MAQRLGVVVFGGITAGTAGLGTWQINRYYWKKDVVEERRRQLKARPVDASGFFAEEEGKTETCTRLSLRGRFEHDKEIIMGPRPPPTAKQTPGNVTIGYYVLTPMTLQGSGHRVLVNRGWSENPQEIARPLEDGVEVTGVLYEGESKSRFSPPNDEEKRRFMWLDVEAAARACSFPSAPSVVNAVAEEGSKGQGLRTRSLESYNDFYVSEDTHLTYATTWFSLAALGTFMTFRRFF